MDDLTDDQVTWLYGRAFFYELCHVLFGGEPDESLVGVLASDSCRDTIAQMAAGPSAALEPLSALVAELDSEEAAAEHLAAWKRVYSRVILGLGGKRASHPWESAYTSSRQLLMQRETLEVRNAYRAFGYLPEMYPRVADDHLALECAFMAALAQKTIDAFAADDEDTAARLTEGQGRFLHDHMAKWVRRYADDLQTDAPDSLYALAAQALAQFIGDDEKFLATLK